MQMILQEVSAHAPTMSIVDGKEWTFRPCCRIFLLWPSHIQNDGYSVLIIISLNTLVRISRIACYQPVRFRRKLRILEVFKRVGRRRCSIWGMVQECIAFLQTLIKSFDYVLGIFHHGFLLLLYFPFTLLNDRIIFSIFVYQGGLELWAWTQSWRCRRWRRLLGWQGWIGFFGIQGGIWLLILFILARFASAGS